jgi:hypothetical protein
MRTPPKSVTATIAGAFTGHFALDAFFVHPGGPEVPSPPKAALIAASTGTALGANSVMVVNAINGSEYRVTPPQDRYSKKARDAYRSNGGST